MNEKKITKLVLAGGGTKGFALLGCLQLFNEYNLLKDINSYWGTSVGSIICTLLLIGYTPLEIFHEIFITDNLVEKYTSDIYTVINNVGLCQIEEFGKRILGYIIKKVGFNPTFNDLYTIYKKHLCIVGTNLTQMKGEYFSDQTHPNMKVIDAIEISCDIPLIFTKKVYNNNTYVDGAFVNNFPIDIADNNENTYILGIDLDFDAIFEYNMSWIVNLWLITIKELHNLRLQCISKNVILIRLQDLHISPFEMSLSKKKKTELYIKGYKQARSNINNKNSYLYKIYNQLLSHEYNWNWDDISEEHIVEFGNKNDLELTKKNK